ncbi:hypothetical protein EFK50_20195 [Nocardioides marmoriginsengisoli]|uniref:Bacterial Ig-like domain-containing protein n=1 Tax=Nocardioides marmoriginsengisoli TaxID=661483 RepID=A0A3N0CB05_9ACTN|nr:choice-of-anchor Q domain-containing protein [Nocardioides marmoriginsengisoli]RNL60637.1 hypothetical protein EFK50_20195 [Nocardioides marmoriginsengisoli]
MKKISVLIAALVVPAFPILGATPAYAADNVICVANPVGVSCNETAATIPAAIATASANSVADVIRVGAGTFSDGPYTLSGGANGLTLQGSGPSTVITLPPGGIQTYVFATAATVRDLKILMATTTTDGDRGIWAGGGSTVRDVTIDGQTAQNATGLQVKASVVDDVSIQMLGTGTRAVYGEGGATVTDSTLLGADGFAHSGTGDPDVLSRVTVKVGNGTAISTDTGTVNVDNAVLDLGANGSTGLRAANFNPGGTPKSINADHVTIVGGTLGSRGVWAWSAVPGKQQESTISLTNSIVRGVGDSLVVNAGNDGAQGGPSNATINVSYTDYKNKSEAIDANGAGGVVSGAGNLIDVDPLFVNPGPDYRLTAGSPLIDKGNPAAGGPATDRDGHARVSNLVRDLGAYEFADLVAPQTTITGGPTGATRDRTPTFTFASEPGASFACAVDGGAFAPCTGPFTTPTLADGAHTVRVRATDAAANTDASPATRSFKVDTVAPNTRWASKPGKTVRTKKVRFGFRSSEAGSTFQCKLDRGAWRSCSTPRVVAVSKGRHVFSVRARDAAGNLDATPVRHAFKRR